MSQAMCTLFANQTHQTLSISHKDIYHTLKAIGRPGCQVTEAMALQFVKMYIFSCDPHYVQSLRDFKTPLLTMAAGVNSASFLKSMREMLKVGIDGRNLPQYLTAAISCGCAENIRSLCDHAHFARHRYLNNNMELIKLTLSTGSLATIKALIECVIDDHITKAHCVNAMDNTIEVFEYVFNKFGKHLDSFLDDACLKDKPEVFAIIKQSSIKLSLQHIHLAASSNSYKVLEFLLFTWLESPFNNQAPKLRLRTFQSILNLGYFLGHTRIIHMCNSIIKDIKVDDKISLHQDVIMAEPSPTSSRMSTAFHQVFCDRRVGIIIMRMIGSIYRTTLGVKDEKLIKGKQLVESDTLLDYIKYGANDWFLKGYNSVANIYPMSSRLPMYAFIYAESDILNTLLANTNMTFADDDQSHETVLEAFIEQNARCKRPGWEQCIDLLMVNTSRCMLPIDEELISKIQHPALLSKMLNISDTTLPINDHIVKVFFSQTIVNPKAVDMAQLKRYTDLSSSPMNRLLHTKLNNLKPKNDHFQTLAISLFYQSGSDGDMETFERFIRGTPKMDEVLLIALVATFQTALKHGHIGMVKRIHEIITSSEGVVLHQTYRPLFLMAQPLLVGDMDSVNFLLALPIEDEPESDEDDDYYDSDSEDSDDRVSKQVDIMDINESILSLDLLKRLMLRPSVNTSFCYVMARAILKRDQDIINYLEHNFDQFQTDYRYALGAASSIGDVATAKTILANHYHDCLPPLHVSIIVLEDDEERPKALPALSDSHFDEDDNDFIKAMNLGIPNWARIDPAVGMLIANQIERGGKLMIGISHMYQIIGSVSHPQSKMTEEVVHTIICKWISFRPQAKKKSDMINIVQCAAYHSHSLIKLVHSVFTKPIQRAHFIEALPQCAKRGDAQSIQFIIDVARAAPLTTRPKVDRDEIIPSNVESLKVLLDNGIISKTKTDWESQILGFMNEACNGGQIKPIQSIDHLYNNPLAGNIPQYVPSLRAITSAAMDNHYQVISFLFGEESQSSVWRAMAQHPQHIIRLLKLLRFKAFKFGHMKVIRWCTSRINQLEGEFNK
ncbi:hypothetical protein SAMD00019534_113640 [Acytostelium subglobosum LB1]|uniref:hypothetical protein n=1 Tax=Acytostelium subglobosum LB1 TaxID=1410327 RepID=UPI000644D75D|nr:hypothetical protein SAMD00019534_113640 [Acytostelium subglobosum LB1]GAM28188.1 hypothetical protein SAMD00019534_113640 [Acytostelium subglobosum LB1]|eukprot:XP_012748822.1 hypothetical protein SAMD00019534_113640 [Acytostelium subglobosum LB1]